MPKQKKSVAARKSPRRGDTGKAARNGAQSADYRHQEEAVARPDVGTQPRFRKKAPPRTHRYDSSPAPALEWNGQNPAREQGEALIGRAQADLTAISQAEESVRLLLKRALKGEYEDSVREHLAGGISIPFLAGEYKQIAVKDLKEAE